MKNGFQALRGTALAVMVALMSACGSDDAPVDARRPVWVVQPQPGGGAALAFPGEVRAREESPLSFRVGGKLVRRAVDAGARVERGQRVRAFLGLRLCRVGGRQAQGLQAHGHRRGLTIR